MHNIAEFAEEMGKVAVECVLKPGKHCAVLIGDTRWNKHFVPITPRVLMSFRDAGFILREDIIKLQWKKKSTREKCFIIIIFPLSDMQDRIRPALVVGENIDRQIADSLRLMEHKVEYVAEKDAGISDDEVLEMANEKTALLLTADKDFGELVFRQQRVTSGVVLIRLAGFSPTRKGDSGFCHKEAWSRT